MALINCPECNREISDKASACPNCGCPIEEKEKRVSTPKKNVVAKQKNKSKKNKHWKLILIIIAIVLVLLFVGFLAIGAKVSSKINETKDNITPYLDYIGKYVSDDESLEIDDYLYKNKDDVFFMGMKGRITFSAEDNYVCMCTWKSDEEFTEEDYQKKIDDLYIYFGEEPTYDALSYNTGDTYIYYWIDPNNGFSVTCSRDFFMYGSTGYLEINWEAEEDLLEKIKEIPEGITDEDEIPETNYYDESEIGVVENINTSSDIPNELMNDEFKNVIDLFSKGFSQSGLDISDAETYDDGETYIFYLDNLEFLEDECDDSHLQPRIIYNKDAIENNGIPSELFFGYYNPLKSNGYEETVEIVEDIAEALNISDVGLIDNDYSSSSKLAIGDYATFTFINLKIELTVSNTDGEVEIEIVPID